MMKCEYIAKDSHVSVRMHIYAQAKVNACYYSYYLYDGSVECWNEETMQENVRLAISFSLSLPMMRSQANETAIIICTIKMNMNYVTLFSFYLA